MADQPKNRNSDSFFTEGFHFQGKGQYIKAIGAYLESARLEPRNLKALNNAGNCLRSLGRFQEALQLYAKVLKVEPTRNSTLINQSLAYLALNEYEKAWPGYEARLSSITFRKEIITSGIPKWDGRTLKKGQRLFIYSNQGIGDELQMLRFLPIVSQAVDDIVLEVHRAVYNLVKDIPFVSEVRVRPKDSEEIPECHYQCEIFTLPGIFKTGFDRIPMCYRPPFTPDEAIVSLIKEERKKAPSKRHIGLVWSGNPRNDLNPYRACGLVHLLPLLELPDCRFYSLQKGAPTKDLKTFQEKASSIIDLSDRLVDMSSTATAIDELDLLITTDTSVPHLAGTLGAKSWVLLHQTSDWRWTVDRDFSPWYPQIKLWRQERRGDWVSLIERVKSALESAI